MTSYKELRRREAERRKKAFASALVSAVTLLTVICFVAVLAYCLR